MNACDVCDMRIGSILVSLGLLSEIELQDALTLQAGLQPPRSLGDVLLETKRILPNELRYALSIQNSIQFGKRAEAAIATASLAIAQRKRGRAPKLRKKLHGKQQELVRELHRKRCIDSQLTVAVSTGSTKRSG